MDESLAPLGLSIYEVSWNRILPVNLNSSGPNLSLWKITLENPLMPLLFQGLTPFADNLGQAGWSEAGSSNDPGEFTLKDWMNLGLHCFWIPVLAGMTRGVHDSLHVQCNESLVEDNRQEEVMQVSKFFHRCGYPVLVVKKQVGPVTEAFFLDGNHPFIEKKDGSKTPKIINRCPECEGSIKMEKLLTEQPEVSEEKGPTGYMPARI